MGYHTDFAGQFDLNKPLDDDTYEFLVKFNETRRMKRNVDPKYGVEGEFYVLGGGSFGQDRDETIVDYNRPPSTQPGLWCQWKPTDDRKAIEWDQGEKFYNYVEWIQYIIEKILAPKGYVLNGEVNWSGEEDDDRGVIIIKNNEVIIEDHGQMHEILEKILKTKTVLPTLIGIDDQLDKMIQARLKE